MNRLLRIGEISKLYHIGVDSLRYYEKIGLIQPRRAESGYRFYSDREIRQLNVIRDLRELGFPMESIRRYMEFQNVDTAMQLLQEEKQAIREKMKTLRKLQENVEKRIETIRAAENMPLNAIVLKEFPNRNCYRMEKGYAEGREMDILIKELVNRSGDRLYIIGNNQIGSVIPLSCIGGKIAYQAVFAVDENGDSRIPGGKYLCVCYRGAYGQTEQWIGKLKDYGERNGLQLAGDILELLWIDIHTTKNPEEYITELQVPVKGD